MEIRITRTAAAAFIAACCLATELSLVVSVMAADDLNNCLPPSIRKEGVPRGYFIEKSQVNIPCIAKGDGKLTYTWTKNGKQLDLSSEESKKRMTTKPGTGSLVIFKAMDKDEGVYQCLVVNNCGTSLSTTTNLRHAKMAPFPRVEKPDVITKVQGESAVLTCNPPVSVPKATVAWILTDSADQPMTYDEDNYDKGIGFNTVPLNRRVTMDYNGNLYITSVREEDEQDGKTYVCLAQNLMTRSSNKGEDKVIDAKGDEIVEMGVALMWHSNTTTMALQGKRARFKCIFSGQPEPEITWSRVNGKMDMSRMVTDHHELVIKEVQFDDAGEYKCSGKNVLKPDAKAHIFTLNVEAAPQWRVQPRDVTVGVEESASFECEAAGNPKPSIQWFVNGDPYSKDTSKGILNGNTLFFENLDKEDSQVIQCNASNIYGFIWADVYLYVQALPPEIIAKPKDDLIVARDKDVTLTCQVTGKPKPKVVWYKGRQALHHERFVIQDSGDLLIKKTTMKDKGTYTCKAENRFGRISATGFLTVRDKTQIQTEPVSEKVDYFNQVTFTCGATTDYAEMKNLRYIWLKDGAPLDDDDERYKVDGGVVTITDTQSKDTGAYTCVAENGLDNDTATATLEVKAPPDPPTYVTINECLAKKVTLSWKFDDKMRNFDKMLRFTIEYQTQYDTKTWTKATSVPYPDKKVTFQLSPYASYNFRVKAVNKMGTSQPSEPSSTSCETPMAAPDKNPDGVRTDEQYTGFLVIKWEHMEQLEQNGPGFKYIVEVQNMDTMEVETYEIKNLTKSEKRLPVNDVYRPYLISVRARNQVGMAMAPVEPVLGRSGESVPKVIPQNFEIDPEINVTATVAGFQWDPVDTSPEAIQGKFQGYKIRYWKKGEKDTSMHEEIIANTNDARDKRQAVEKVKGRVINLPSFSEIIADVVVINTNFESEGSNKVNLSTPEGVPGKVSILEAIYRGSSHITVYWQSPDQPNGILTGYQLEYRKISSQVVKLTVGEVIIVNETISPEDVRQTIRGLEPDTSYQIIIRARTKVGLGMEKVIDVMTTSENLALTRPVIDEVFALDNEANVSWTLDLTTKGGRTGQVYYLEHRRKGARDWTMSPDPIQDKFWAELDHLDPGTVYQVRVIAMASRDGRKQPSEIHMFRTSGIGAARASFLTAGWFIGMMVAIAILILILIIVCLIKRSRGDNYPVQEKERLRGNCDDNHDQFNEFGKGSDENGIGGSSSFDCDGEKVPLDADADSMDYGDDDASKFNEDGSFIGQYGRGDKANDVANVSASSIV